MKTEVTTAKDSKFKAASRKTTMGLRFCGWDNRGCFSMRSTPGTLKNEEAMIVREPWIQKANGSKVRICYKGDNSERWIERA